MPLGRKESEMSKTIKKRNSKKRRASKKRNRSNEMKDFWFVECPIAGLFHFKTGKIKCGMYMFDSIDFYVTDINHECFEIKGLRFDLDKGWYDPNANTPKYYGKDVYEACMEYAVDRAIEDGLYLGLAICGQRIPAEFVLRLSHSKIIKMMKERTGKSVMIFDEHRNMKIA